MNVVREIITVLGFSANMRGINQYENRIQAIPNNVRPVVNQLRNMFAGVFAGLGVVSGVGNIIQAGDQMTKVMNRMRESALVPAESFEALYASARETGVAMDETSKAFMRFAPAMRTAGFGDGDTVAVLDGLQKGLLLAGSTAAETGSVLTQLGQAIGSNNFAGDELKSFMENASPQIISEFARALGVTSAEIKKMGSEGKLTNRTVIPALIASARAGRDSFGNMVVTVELAMARSRVAWVLFASELEKTIGLNSALVRGFTYIGNSLDYVRTKLPVIAEFITKQVGLRNILEFVGITLTLVYGPALLRMLSLATGAALRFAFTVGLPALAIGLLAVGIQDVLTYMQGGESIIGNFIKTLNPAFVEGFNNALTFMSDAINVAWQAISGFVIFLKDEAIVVFDKLLAFFGSSATVGKWGDDVNRAMGIATAGVMAAVAALTALRTAAAVLGWIGMGAAGGTAAAAAGAAAVAPVASAAAGVARTGGMGGSGLGIGALSDVMARVLPGGDMRETFMLPAERRRAAARAAASLDSPAFDPPNGNGMPTGLYIPNQNLQTTATINQEINVIAPGADGASLASTVGTAARSAGENAMRFGNDLARDLLRGNPMTEAGAR